MITQLQKERSVITVKELDILLRCVKQNNRSGKIDVVSHGEFEEHSTNIEEARNLHVCDDDSSSDEYIFYVGNDQKDKFELKVND